MKTVKMKNKNRSRQIASAMIASIMLIQAVPPAHSTGIPVHQVLEYLSSVQEELPESA